MKLNIKHSEKDVKRSITEALRLLGWHVYRINNAGTYDQKTGGYFFHGSKGISDLIAWKDGKMIFIEVKSSKGKLSVDQEDFLRMVNMTESISGVLAKSTDDVLNFIKGGSYV